MSNLKLGHSDIGKLNSNKCDDFDFVAKALELNMQILNLSKAGKPKTAEDMEERISQYFLLCKNAKLNPTVERFSTLYRL